ncbi:MAG: AAA family ATPase, partial [Candidatus Binatia bacterium]
MSLLQDILEWSQTLPGWQSDAARRLFVKGQLSEQDTEDLLALLKAEHGIADPQGRTAIRLSQDHIPAPSKPDRYVHLIAMKELRNVNAIAENQRLPFAEKGLTVVYGDNGSGKSGYGRVLKRACRARDQTEDILPNAKLPSGKGGRPEAQFELAINGTPTDEHWTDGSAASDALSSIAIFDGRCARAYLDKEDDFAYVPYGLDIFEGLAQLCNRLKARLDNEYIQNTPN